MQLKSYYTAKVSSMLSEKTAKCFCMEEIHKNDKGMWVHSNDKEECLPVMSIHEGDIFNTETEIGCVATENVEPTDIDLFGNFLGWNPSTREMRRYVLAMVTEITGNIYDCNKCNNTREQIVNGIVVQCVCGL